MSRIISAFPGTGKSHFAENNLITYLDNGRSADAAKYSGDLLTPLFENGKLIKETTLKEIKERMHGKV